MTLSELPRPDPSLGLRPLPRQDEIPERSRGRYASALSAFEALPSEYRLFVSSWGAMDWRARALLAICFLGFIPAILVMGVMLTYFPRNPFPILGAMLLILGAVFGGVVVWHRAHNAITRSRRRHALEVVDRFLGQIGYQERVIRVPNLRRQEWSQRDRRGRIVDSGTTSFLPEWASDEVVTGVDKFGYDEFRKRADAHNELSTQLDEYRHSLAQDDEDTSLHPRA